MKHKKQMQFQKKKKEKTYQEKFYATNLISPSKWNNNIFEIEKEKKKKCQTYFYIQLHVFIKNLLAFFYCYLKKKKIYIHGRG